MPNKGSNDLNMMLKARVVKLKVELDAKGSKLHTQVDNISKMLSKKPVKLKVKLDVGVQDLNKQLRNVSNTLAKSKSFKPIKIGVEIDVKGSANNIKKQLQDVNKVVSEFNKKYSKQLKEMQASQAKSQKLANESGKGLNIKNTASVQGFNNIKNYVKQLEQAEKQLRGKFSDGKGLFSSLQLKDAQGNLHGFVASLERASGVVEKVRYQWNKDKDQFQVIDRQTATNTERMVHKSMQQLQDLQRELGKTGKSSKELKKEYDKLMDAGSKGTLTQDAVKAFQTRVKNAQEEVRVQQKNNELKREEAKILRDIKNITKGINDTRINNKASSLVDKTKNAKDAESYKDIRLEVNRLSDAVKQYNSSEKEKMNVAKQSQQAVRQLNKYLRETHETEGALSRDNIKAVTELARRATTTKQMAEVQKQLNAMYKAQQYNKDATAREQALAKLQRTMLEYGKVVGRTSETIDRKFQMSAEKTKHNLAAIEKEVAYYSKKIAQAQNNATRDILNRANNSIVKEVSHTKVRSLVNEGDVQKLKEYLAQVLKLDIATAKLSTNSQGVTRITTTLASTGKTAKQVTYEIDQLNNKLRQVGQQDVFNRNANLGIFEQMKVALQRVPVWMASMTAFYGSINAFKSMAQEILQVDHALTELKRVASSSLNIDTIFQGSVSLSKELGNNIHDIMQAVNDLSRTYGEFNERQLLAVSKTAILMSNVSDLSVDDALKSLVGTMNAFNIAADDSIHIVDALNQVDNDYAISTQQLSEGLSRSASTARTFGVSLEENIGQITAIGAVTMESGSIIGNSLKTIYSRITTVNEAKEAIEGVGIAMYKTGQDGKKTIRDVNEILTDLAGKWTALSAEQRQNIAVTLAGRYQLSRFLALMNNWEMATKATRTALSSQGSAIRENAKLMESFEARINKLKNSFTEMAIAVGKAFLSGAMLNIIEGLSNLAQAATKVVSTVGALPVMLGVLGTIAARMGVFNKAGGSMIAMLSLMKTSFLEARAGATGFGGTLRGVAGSTRAFQVLLPTLTAGIRAVGVALKGLLASTGVGLAFVALGVAIEKLIGHFEKQKKIQEKIERDNKALVDSYRNTAGGLENLIKKQQELQDKVNSGTIKEGTDAYNEYVQVTNDLAEKMPTIVKYVDQSGLAHLKETKAIKDQLQYAKELSEIKAKTTQLDYETDLDKILEKYDKETEKIKELDKALSDLKEKNGKNRVISTQYGLVDTGLKEDTRKDQQKNLEETLQAEQKKQEYIQQTLTLVQNTSMAYLESDRDLKNLTDTGKTVIEQMVQQNEELIRAGKNTDGMKKNANELLDLSKSMGKFMSDTYEQMTKGVEDPMKLEEIKTNIDNIIKALPDTFFKIESLDNVDELKAKFQGVLSVADQIKGGSGDFSGLVSGLQQFGFTADEAKAYVAKLGVQYNNTEIRAKAMAQAQNEGQESLENWVDTAIKAIDVSQQLFNVSDEDVSAMKSHVETLQGLIARYGENNAKNMDAFKESIQAISLYTGVPDATIQKDLGYYHNVLDLLGKVELQYNENTGALEGFNKEGLNNKQIEILNRAIQLGKDYGVTYDLITQKMYRISDGVEMVFDKNGKLVEKVKETNKEIAKDPEKNGQKDAIEKTGKSADKTKQKIKDMKNEKMFNEGDTSPDTAKGKVDGVKGSLADLAKKQNEIKGQSIFDTADTSPDTTKQKVDDVGKSASDTKKKIEEMKQEDLFDMSKLDDGAQAKVNELTEAIKKASSSAELLDKLNSGLAKSATQTNTVGEKLKNLATSMDTVKNKTGAINTAKDAVEKMAVSLLVTQEKVGGLFNKLSDSATKMVEPVKSAKSAVSKFGSTADEVKGKIKGLSGSISKVGKTDIKGLGSFSKQLQSLAKNYQNATSSGNKTASSQLRVASAFSKVVSVTRQYNNAMHSAGNGVGSAYNNMSKAITSATRTIVTQYNKNSEKLKAMVKENINSLKQMSSGFEKAGKSAVNVVEKMTNKMHKAFKSGMSKIVSTAKGVPAQIGKAIKDNMSDASDAMDSLAKDMVKRFKKELGIHSPSRVFEDLGYWTIKGLSNGLTGEDLKSLGKNVFDDFGGGIFDSWDMIKAYVSGDFSNIAPEGGASGWKPMIMAAAKQMGENLTPREVNGIIAQIGRESGGNQAIVQSPSVVDINTLSGNPARGLLQYIPQTFNAYKVPGHGNIYSGFDQLLAFFNNKNWRRDLPYGRSGWGPSGGRKFAKGGFITQEINNATIGEAGKEVIIPLEQYRSRALSLWAKAGSELGIDPELLEMMKENARAKRGRGGVAFGGGATFGASSAEGGGGESSGGGDSGSSGIMRESIYAGYRNLDGGYNFTALKTKTNPYENRADAFTYNKYERSANGFEASIQLATTKMNALDKSTLKYRDSLKQVVALSNSHLATLKKDLSVTEKRQNTIKKELSKLPKVSKQTTKQRDQYNKLMQEYDSNLSKIASLKNDIQTDINDIKDKSLEIFTDFITEIVTKYDNAITSIKNKIDDTEFKIDVLGFTSPNDKKALLNAQIDKANQLQSQQATGKNKVNALQSQYDKVKKSKGSSSKEAKAVKEQLDQAKEEYEDYTIAVLQAEKEIQDTRAAVADDGIKTLKDYYQNVKEMATAAIDAELDELQKSHEKKMDLYDEEINKITSVYDEKLKAMDAEKAEADYQEELDSKNAKKSELVNKIALLSRDTSLEGKKKLAELQKDLADINKEISDFQKDRQDELLRTALEEQKQKQIDAVTSDKEKETEKYEKDAETLNKQKETVAKQYDDLINNDAYWAKMREDAIKGNFKTLTSELNKMKTNLDNMNKGMFDSLFKGFSGLSDAVKKQIADTYGLTVDNMLYNSKEPISDVKEASGAKGYTMKNGKVVSDKGTKVTTPTQTTTKKKTETKTSTKKKTTTTKKKTTAKKTPKVGGKVKVSASNANAYMDAYGHQVRPWSKQAKAAGVSYGSSLYMVNSKNGYGALSKTKSVKGAIAWVKLKDLTGLRTGGYTGDWAGNGGKVALLHKKELVLNERQTSDILDVAKIVKSMETNIPNLKRGNVNSKLDTASTISTNISFGDINVTVENGDKKKASDIATELIKGLKKKGGI
ncbi:phage tail tape measure protein [Bacillus subtilis]|uniref:Uncharacterized protein n=1 Tax=Bacillus phage vB_BsuS_PJN02 TaxID=2920374 RepID=A0AC61TRT4_9CAUD|nr:MULTISPECIES: phage tail tape measure protein [Bacillus subtilis group]YP_010681669.1 hypothetical protein PQE76_gp051 [Bacillus phage vB_BsuS_PJN02]UPG35843.1 putative tape measure protein [Bacillus phage 2S-4]MCR4361979.1 phage tail tape measure protein [Bacillus subtilis]UNH58394.1 hypothetical protein [Bacillus phage vB_BsuS_PJN02]UQB84204.1 phage tail tape measure protein [Bacillus amyloliquefaciens]WOF33040.1 phage tail tape measure protein [Bacillus subtilis]